MISNHLPITGKVVISLLITVAPQYLICPHGNTYPKNATNINITYINLPISQVNVLVLYLL